MDPKLVLTLICVGVLGWLYVRYKRDVGQEMTIAFLFGLFITAYHPYTYTTPNIFIGEINLYPLVLWTLGLVLLREAYERLRMPNKFLVACLIYWSALFAIEYIGYYLLGIQLDSDYRSLLGLGIIHGPPVIYVFYLAAGPVFLGVTNYLRIK